MAISEVAKIRENIATEYQAAMWGLSGLASGVSRHDFINARIDKIGAGQKQLAMLIGEQQAAALIGDTLVALSEKPDRDTLPALLTSTRGHTEATALLIDHIREMWETIDLLNKEFGAEGAQKIIHAPGFVSINQPAS